MSPQTRKELDSITIFIKRIGVSVVSFMAAWLFYAASSSFFAVKHNVDLLFRQDVRWQEWIKNHERRADNGEENLKELAIKIRQLEECCEN